MSHIDQAFINAYSDEAAVAQVSPRSASSPRFAVASAPTLRVFGNSTETESRVDPPQVTNAARRPIAEPTHPQTLARSATLASSATAEDIQTLARSATLEEAEEELTLPSLVGERKPLSSFATPKEAPQNVFRPAFEVDEFRWPAITDELVGNARHLLTPVVDALLAAASEGCSVVGIAGTSRGVGASTVTMCLARMIAEAGHSIAIIDGHFAKPNLAAGLGLEFETGWHSVLDRQIPLAECAVLSLGDRMTLIPLGMNALASADRLASIQSSVIAGMLRYHHEVVLFDLGAADNPRQLAIAQNIVEHCRLDVGMVVTPTGARDLANLHGMEQLTTMFGPLCLGVVGNHAQ
jgi:Mrp family chromosome partitioning ATPase